MKEILEAVYGLLIAPEAEDPLDRLDRQAYFQNKTFKGRNHSYDFCLSL